MRGATTPRIVAACGTAVIVEQLRARGATGAQVAAVPRELVRLRVQPGVGHVAGPWQPLDKRDVAGWFPEPRLLEPHPFASPPKIAIGLGGQPLHHRSRFGACSPGRLRMRGGAGRLELPISQDDRRGSRSARRRGAPRAHQDPHVQPAQAPGAPAPHRSLRCPVIGSMFGAEMDMGGPPDDEATSRCER